MTPVSHLYTVGARIESTRRYNLREVVLRKRNYCAADYLRLLYRVTIVFIGFMFLKYLNGQYKIFNQHPHSSQKNMNTLCKEGFCSCLIQPASWLGGLRPCCDLNLEGGEGVVARWPDGLLDLRA